MILFQFWAFHDRYSPVLLGFWSHVSLHYGRFKEALLRIGSGFWLLILHGRRARLRSIFAFVAIGAASSSGEESF